MRPLSKKRRVEILRRVARHIRRWPHLFNFYVGRIPKRGKPCQACILARAGVMLGVKRGTSLDGVARAIGFGSANAEGIFYDRVRSALVRRFPAGLGDIGFAPATEIAQAIEDVAAAL